MKNLSFIILLSLIFACSKLFWKDDKLSINRENYIGNQIRIDGYFYEKKGGNYYSLYCFYQNGVLLSMGGMFSSESEIESYIQKEFIQLQTYKNTKIHWGVYDISDTNIKFERWYPGPPNKAFVREGKILNDSTFTITQSYRVKKGKKTEVREKDETYYLKKFSPKPDSTNTFIE